METRFTEEQLKGQIKKNAIEAEALINDRERMDKFLEKLEKKLSKVSALEDNLEYIPLLLSLVKAYVNREYRIISIASMVSIVSAFLYFVTPFDLVPDSIPVVGYSDDMAVIDYVWNQVKTDAEKYRKWRSGAF